MTPRDTLRPIGTTGSGLQRPESVLPISEACVLVSDARGGVSAISADGTTRLICESPDNRYAEASESPLRFIEGDTVNGLSVGPDGRLWAANIGRGVIEIIHADGSRDTVFDALAGRPMGLVNFPAFDPDGDLWVSISATDPENPASGVIAHSRHGVPLKVVAGNLRGPNELRFHPSGDWFVVAETLGQRILRFDLLPGGRLSQPRPYGPETLGGFPDGIVFDSEGGLWGVLIGRDEIYRIDPSGRKETLFRGGDQNWFDDNEAAFLSGELKPSDMIPHACGQAPLFSSLAFGGPDLSSLFVGSLCGTHLPVFQSPIPGLRPDYWGRDRFFQSQPSQEACL